MILDWFKRLFKKSDSLDSLTQMTHSDELTHSLDSLTLSPRDNEDIRLQKDALELGLAAGYAGHSLKSIQTSLERLESLIITKDWASQELLPLIKAIDSNEQKRFETLVSIINSLDRVVDKSPPELKSELISISSQLEKHGDLTNRMVKLIEAVKESGKISYTDLANKLNMTEDGLRSLVSIVCKKTSEIQKIKINDKTWVRHVPKNESLGQITHSLTQENEI